MKTNILFAIVFAVCLGQWRHVSAQKPKPDYTGIKSVQEIEDGKLKSLTIFNRNGQPIFEKELDFRNYLEMKSTEYDEEGRVSRVVSGYYREDGLLTAQVCNQNLEKITVLNFPPAKVQLGANIGSKLSDPKCSIDGFPNNSEELLAFVDLKQLIDGPSELESITNLGENGKVIDRKDYDFGQFSRHVWYTHDANGKKIKLIVVSIATQQDTTIIDYTYSSDGSLLKETSSEKKHGQWSIRLETSYAYENNRLTMILVTGYGKEYTKTMFEYDGQERLIKETESSFLFSKPKITNHSFGEGSLPIGKTVTKPDYSGNISKTTTKYIYERW